VALQISLQQIEDALVARVVEAVHPQRIILFGSAARGQMGPHSDIDVLVVMPNGVNRRETLRVVGRALFDLGHPKDVVVVTEDDVRRFADNPSLVVNAALREGREIYCAA
jgi:predicted nucleotidyltransferase